MTQGPTYWLEHAWLGVPGGRENDPGAPGPAGGAPRGSRVAGASGGTTRAPGTDDATPSGAGPVPAGSAGAGQGDGGARGGRAGVADGAVLSGVVVETAGGRVTAVRPGHTAPPSGATALRGLTLPGFADAHSHAFHRALRGSAQTGGGSGAGTAPDSFWTWRELMYASAAALTPETYYALARATYAEMALAGITAVGEFHYVHHRPDGTPYAMPGAMGEALIAAAADAGIRITLLDTAYLASGLSADPGGAPLDARQLRFSDGTADAWAERASALADAAAGSDHALVGAAVHSVRAVPAAQLATVAEWAARRRAPLHVHLSEQPAENEACLAVHGLTPTRLLAEHGVLGPRTTAVHATHLTDEDIALLGSSGTGVCMCPTTERDLADGIGPARALERAGSPLSLGSDSHAVIDLFEEARALELDERLRTRTRGHWSAADLLRAAGAGGHAALGRPDAGRIRPGAPADWTTLALDSVRTAGPPLRHAPETAVFAGSAADVRHTVVAGRHVVRDGTHQLVPDVPAALAASVAALRGE